jgi:hypothetical protein
VVVTVVSDHAGGGPLSVNAFCTLQKIKGQPIFSFLVMFFVKLSQMWCFMQFSPACPCAIYFRSLQRFSPIP